MGLLWSVSCISHLCHSLENVPKMNSDFSLDCLILPDVNVSIFILLISLRCSLWILLSGPLYSSPLTEVILGSMVRHHVILCDMCTRCSIVYDLLLYQLVLHYMGVELWSVATAKRNQMFYFSLFCTKAAAQKQRQK